MMMGNNNHKMLALSCDRVVADEPQVLAPPIYGFHDCYYVTVCFDQPYSSQDVETPPPSPEPTPGSNSTAPSGNGEDGSGSDGGGGGSEEPPTDGSGDSTPAEKGGGGGSKKPKSNFGMGFDPNMKKDGE